MTNEEIIEVVTAANNGSTIECKRKFDTNKTWHVCNSPAWDFYNYEYRAKPKILRHKVSAVLIGTKEEIEYALDTGDFSNLILQILNNEDNNASTKNEDITINLSNVKIRYDKGHT